MHIQVVGSGCPNCNKLEALCKEVVNELRLDAQIEKVIDINRFAELGVYITPGLLINGQLKSAGKIPVKATLAHWLEDSAKQ
ncbi:MAG TPA: thioredoxin family protein [Caldithrix abyssi]|uniref:Thioredoxin family protein n=1 Tax=Caldithrix abyssi TaxID=187145 RepID=A0A7V4WVD1_CALAY|nr:thioredoxin family protein [Caldithrix abyssi]